MNTRYYLRLLRTLALAALTAAATAACSDDNGDPDGREPITPDDANPGIAVNFTANINPGSDADPDTRTVLDSDGNGGFTVTWKAKNDYPNNYDLIRIWAAEGNTLANSGIPKDYVPTTSAASSELVPDEESDKFTLPSAGNWMFAAIYGHSGAGGTGLAAAMVSPQMQVAPNNIEHIAMRDFSAATATQYIAADSEMPLDISLKFEHKLSALQLRVTNQTGEALTVKEIRLSVTGDKITTYKKYDVTTGKWKADGEQKSDYLQLEIFTPAALPSDGTAQDFHMLLFPGYADTDMTITVITDRGEYSRTKGAPTGGFLAAKNYLTNITLRTDGLQSNETWRETIRNKEELAAFRERVNGGNNYSGKTVYLVADIDLTGETWTPIGMNYNKRFSGTFDGGGYSISNLNVNFSIQYAGLFGYVSGGTVRNLRVCGNVTTSEMYTGGIAGSINSSSTVENCIFSGNLSGENFVGGIAGKSSESGKIAGCHVNGSVTATAGKAGGIAGVNQAYSTIDDCYSEAEVKGSYAGGIAGENQSVGAITRCYATGQVSGTSYAGGIAGSHTGLRVNGCIALNPGLTRTDGNETTFGRIVGNNQGTSPVNSCGAYDGMTFTDANGSFTATGEHGTALPAADCLTPAAYTSRNFPEATATTPGWAFDTAAPWQYLPWNKVFEDFPGITNADEYRIKVPDHLKAPVIP